MNGIVDDFNTMIEYGPKDIWAAFHGKPAPSAIRDIGRESDALSAHANTYQAGPLKGQSVRDPGALRTKVAAEIASSKKYSDDLADANNTATLWLCGAIGLGALIIVFGGRR